MLTVRGSSALKVVPVVREADGAALAEPRHHIRGDLLGCFMGPGLLRAAQYVLPGCIGEQLSDNLAVRDVVVVDAIDRPDNAVNNWKDVVV